MYPPPIRPMRANRVCYDLAAIDSIEFSCARVLITNETMTVADYQELHHDCGNHHDDAIAGTGDTHTCEALLATGEWVSAASALG